MEVFTIACGHLWIVEFNYKDYAKYISAVLFLKLPSLYYILPAMVPYTSHYRHTRDNEYATSINSQAHDREANIKLSHKLFVRYACP